MPVSDHNGAEHLTVMYRWNTTSGLSPVGKAWPPGWYVVRTCRCHYNRPVTVPFTSRERAEHVRELLLKTSEACGT